jgi:hypothetical protein
VSKEAITNEQSRYTGNIWHKTTKDDKKIPKKESKVNNPETKATLGTRHIRKTTKNEEYKIQRHRKHRTQDTEQIQKKSQ